MKTDILTQPIQIGDMRLENRVLIQPMEGCDGKASGGISPLTQRRYLRFAESGVGLIWFEAVAVCHEGRANPNQLYLNEENKDEFAELIKKIKSVSTEKFGFAPKIIIQLTHSGRQSRPDSAPAPVYASNNEYLNSKKPLSDSAVYADEEYLASLPSLFVKSAKLAQEVGFDGVDVKCCHGYLFNELMSAYDRKDCFGGAEIENRARLYLETYSAVMQAVGTKMTVTSRLGVYDGFDYPYGFGVNENNEADLTESFYVIDRLYENGLRLLNITIGNPYINPHVNRPYRAGAPEDGKIGVDRIKKITKAVQSRYPDLAVVLSGATYPMENSMEQAQQCINDGVCSLVGFGRMAFAYPDFYTDYLKNGTLDKNKVCITCGNCSKMMRAGGVAGCPVRDKEEYLPRFKQLAIK